jgi:integrase
MLTRSKLSGLRLDELTDEHAQQFASEFCKLSPSGINRGLRTLRRALNLAYQWNQLDKPVKVELAKGENQRDRVLTESELTSYLEACPQPWQDIASVLAEEGMRPGEVFALRWPHIFMGEDGSGLIRVVNGKSKAARRILPMTPNVRALLQSRHETQGRPADGWIFPSGSRCGHVNGDGVKDQHRHALLKSGVTPFVPYELRHTALTGLGKAARGDVFALAKIAGHSTITITQRYVLPEAETIDQVFSRTTNPERIKKHGIQTIGTKLGTAAILKRAPLLEGQQRPRINISK